MDEVGVASAIFRGVAFDVKDDVGFVFGASGVLERDEEFIRIEMNAELMLPFDAADAEIAHQGLFADHGFFPGDLIPLLAFVLHGS